MATRGRPIDQRRAEPCARGHDRSDAILKYHREHGKPYLRCRKCRNEAQKRWRLSRKNRPQTILQIVTCQQCGHESRLDPHEVVGPDIIMECCNPNCGLIFFAAPENTQTFSWDGKTLSPAPMPGPTGPTDEELAKA